MTQDAHDHPIPQEIDLDSELPIGPRLADPGPAQAPGRIVLEGRYARLEPLEPARHRDGLHAASTPPDRAARFRYMPELPPVAPDAFGAWLAGAAASPDPLFFAAARDDAAVSNSRHCGTIRHAERGHIQSIAKPMILDSLHSSAPAPAP